MSTNRASKGDPRRAWLRSRQWMTTLSECSPTSSSVPPRTTPRGCSRASALDMTLMMRPGMLSPTELRHLTTGTISYEY